jgi:NAD(P)-dependent dehydrogenase (short-subunit alcohol dehydrogenase family)
MIIRMGKMKILIIGGTNFIGPAVVQHLTAMDHKITLFHRGKTVAKLTPDVDHIFGERTRLADFKTQFEKISPDVVLDMFPYTEQDALTLMKTFKGIAQRVVAISSVDVYRAYDVLWCKEPDLVPVLLTEDSSVRQQLYPFRDMSEKPLDELLIGSRLTHLRNLRSLPHPRC